DKIITEIVDNPKDESLIYYLGASTFEHYSPVARTAPHDFDIYSYHTDTGDIKRHTTLDKYNISSLQLSRTDQIAYITMDDDLEADTAEDIFESKQRTFSVPLDQPEQLSVFDYTSHTEDIYSMLYI